MCCLFTTLLLAGPRVAGVIWWLASPTLWRMTFTSWLWPVLGLIFLPWTTLMYVIVAPGGIVGFEWVWLALAFVVDLISYSGSAYGNRNRIQSYRQPPL